VRFGGADTVYHLGWASSAAIAGEARHEIKKARERGESSLGIKAKGSAVVRRT